MARDESTTTTQSQTEAPSAPAAPAEPAQEIGFEVASGLTPSQVALLAVEAAINAFNGAAGMFAISSADGEYLEIIAHRGFPEKVVTPFQHLPIQDLTPATTAFRRREMEILETSADYCAHYPQLAAMTTGITGTRALVSIPLLLDGRVLGVLGVTFQQDRPFSQEDRALALELAGQWARSLAQTMSP